MKNKAAILTGIRSMELGETEIPVCGDDDVLVKVEYVGICGSDVLFFKNGRIGAKIAKPPFILGHEAAGTVCAVGKNVVTVSVGDSVTIEPGVPCGHCRHCLAGRYNICRDLTFCGTPPINGLYRQYVSHPAAWVHKLPEAVSLKAGSMIEPLAVGVHAAKMGEVNMDKSVLVIGGGCIGLMSLLSSKHFGSKYTILADRHDKRLNKALELGADAVVNSAQTDLMDKVMELTNGEGADVVIEATGNPIAAYQAAKLVARGGTVVQVGTIPEDLNYNVRTLEVNEATLKVLWRYCNDFPTAIQIAARDPERFSSIATDVFEAEDIQQAFEKAINDKENVIKAVIHF